MEPYCPLERNEIRLVVLEPKDGSDAVSFRLKHVHTSELPTYEALSYTWGKERCQTTLRGSTRYPVRHSSQPPCSLEEITATVYAAGFVD